MIFDLHIHSKYSFDSLLQPSKIIKIAKKNGLDGIAITDHNTIKGGLEAKTLIKDDDFTVIVGCETNTEIGDIIGLFLNEEIISKNSFEVIEEIKSQGGLVILPHPYRGHKLSEKLIKSVDIIEGFNARTGETENEKAVKLGLKYKKPIIAGSDAHFGKEIGLARTHLTNASSNLGEKMMREDTSIQGTSSPPYLTVASQIIKSFKMKEFGEVPGQLLYFGCKYSKYNLSKIKI